MHAWRMLYIVLKPSANKIATCGHTREMYTMWQHYITNSHIMRFILYVLGWYPPHICMSFIENHSVFWFPGLGMTRLYPMRRSKRSWQNKMTFEASRSFKYSPKRLKQLAHLKPTPQEGWNIWMISHYYSWKLFLGMLPTANEHMCDPSLA